MRNGNIRSVLLIDDDSNDNFFHEREIRKVLQETQIVVRTSGIEGLEYIKSGNAHPDVIFLDINMPVWDGWAFLLEFSRLEEVTRQGIDIIIVTTFLTEADEARAGSWSFVKGFIPKPLTSAKLEALLKNG
jgi:CheY-like chemotaxis protein